MRRLVVLLLALCFAATGFAEPIKQIVFFGDSLTDNGNLYRLMLKRVPKSPPYYDGRFSNGPTWAEVVGQYYADNYHADVANYAYGGATVVFHKPNKDDTTLPIMLQEEVYNYNLHNRSVDKHNVLFTFWIGANDYLTDPSNAFGAKTDAVINKLTDVINGLIKQGAQDFLILNLPDLSKTPFAVAKNDELRLLTLSQMNNDKLKAALDQLQTQNPNLKIVLFDTNALLNDIMTHPDQYNQQYQMHISDVNTACWQGGWTLPPHLGLNQTDQFVTHSPDLAVTYATGLAYTQGLEPCADPDSHIFWDVLHPTQAIHKTLGQIVLDTLKNHGLG